MKYILCLNIVCKRKKKYQKSERRNQQQRREQKRKEVWNDTMGVEEMRTACWFYVCEYTQCNPLEEPKSILFVTHKKIAAFIHNIADASESREMFFTKLWYHNMEKCATAYHDDKLKWIWTHVCWMKLWCYVRVCARIEIIKEFFSFHLY